MSGLDPADETDTLAAPALGQKHGAPAELTRGAVIGRYVVLARLGAGAMGVVYAAYDPELDRKVALKLLLPSRGDREAARARLQREAQALAKLSHPNVVAVHDVGVVDERIYVAMEFVEGRTVTAWLAEGPRSWREVVAVFEQAARGLAAAHAEGLLHRDVKPDNLMIDERNRVRVMDFGLVRNAEKAGTKPDLDEIVRDERRASAASAIRTQAGAILGTPAYMAPEQFEGEAIDARTDQFGLCVALWEALYGERPFAGDSLIDLVGAVTRGERRPPPSGRSIPGWLRRTVERGLEVRPDDRWPTMEALLTALSRDPARRRASWLGVGLLLTVGGVAGAAWWRQDARLCSRAADELRAVWNDERRSAVEQGLLATGLPYAPGVWERAAPKLDAWAEAWVAMHTQTCEATRRDGAQSEAVMDLRMACLYRARQGLDAAATVLGEATPGVVEKAHEVVGALPELSRCADIEALQADVPPPDDDEAEAVDAIRGELAESWARQEAGQLDAAFAAVQRAEGMLEGISYEPVVTEVDVCRGFVQHPRGEYDDAEAALRRALRRAARYDQREALRDATTELIWVVGVRQRRHEEALGLREIAEGLASGHRGAEARLRTYIANMLYLHGELDEAESLQRQALADRIEALGADHPDVAATRNNLAGALYAQGKYAEAEAEQREALAQQSRVLGPDHPKLAQSRDNLGIVLYAQGKFEEAETQHRTALAQQLKIVGAEHPDIAQSRNNLANVLEAQGKLVEAETEHRAALALWTKTLGAEHPNVAQSHHNLGGVLNAQGDNAEAETQLRAALAIWLKTLGSDHPNVALARTTLAAALRAQGKYEDAEAELRAALAAQLETVGADHPDVAATHGNLGVVLETQGKHAEAEAEFRAALALQKKNLTREHPEIANSLRNIASVVLAQGHRREAIALLEEAWAIHERAPLPPMKAGDVAFSLAEARWADGDHDRARALAERALAQYERAESLEPALPRKVEQWLRDHPAND